MSADRAREVKKRKAELHQVGSLTGPSQEWWGSRVRKIREERLNVVESLMGGGHSQESIAHQLGISVDEALGRMNRVREILSEPPPPKVRIGLAKAMTILDKEIHRLETL